MSNFVAAAINLTKHILSCPFWSISWFHCGTVCSLFYTWTVLSQLRIGAEFTRIFWVSVPCSIIFFKILLLPLIPQFCKIVASLLDSLCMLGWGEGLALAGEKLYVCESHQHGSLLPRVNSFSVGVYLLPFSSTTDWFISLFVWFLKVYNSTYRMVSIKQTTLPWLKATVSRAFFFCMLSVLYLPPSCY